MAKTLPDTLTALLLSTLFGAATAAASPVAPGNLKADVNGLIVDLSWSWGNAGAKTLAEDFESEKFPPSGWDWEKNYTYATDGIGNWMHFVFNEEDEKPIYHDGPGVAMLSFAQDGDETDLSTLHQDEWLMVTPGKGAEYMDFWYYLHPMLLEYGAYRDFPDHYFVCISRDNGETWTELWDGRWDISNEDDIRQASLFLGAPCDEHTLVAFRAVSDEYDSLNFLWVVDDVEFFTATEAASRELNVKALDRNHRKLTLPEGMKLYKEFAPRDMAKRVARIPEDDWLNAGQTTFRVYLDDEIVGDYIKSRHFTDVTGKTRGNHTYRVLAWNEAEDREYAAAEISVDIDDFTFGIPRNVQSICYEDPAGSGRYSIEVTWEAPDTEMQPAYYDIFINDKWYGQMSSDEPTLRAGQSGLYPGVYTFGVQACYLYPVGTSEVVTSSVFPGTVAAPLNLTAEENANGFDLSWQMGSGNIYTPESFRIFRGDEEIAKDVKEMKFSDLNVKAGSYLYSVHACYTDGTQSLPAETKATMNARSEMILPFKETFDNGHLPANWDIELVDPRANVKDMYKWRFDNWFGIDTSEADGVEGGFAAVSGIPAGLNRLETHLYLPELNVPVEEGKEAVVEYYKYFSEPESGPTGPAIAELQILPEGKTDWISLSSLTDTPNGNAAVSLGKYAGKHVALRFSFCGRYSGELIVDNVNVSMKDASGVEGIAIDAEDTVDVITLDGVTLLHGVRMADASDLLAPGVYLLRTANAIVKARF